jgi:hypothetical protein
MAEAAATPALAVRLPFRRQSKPFAVQGQQKVDPTKARLEVEDDTGGNAQIVLVLRAGGAVFEAGQ